MILSDRRITVPGSRLPPDYSEPPPDTSKVIKKVVIDVFHAGTRLNGSRGADHVLLGNLKRKLSDCRDGAQRLTFVKTKAPNLWARILNAELCSGAFYRHWWLSPRCTNNYHKDFAMRHGNGLGCTAPI